MAEFIPIYNEVNLGTVRPLTAEGYIPTFWESVGHGIAEGWDYGPTMASYRQHIVRNVQGLSEAMDDYESDLDFVNNHAALYEEYRRPSRYMPIEAQKEKIKSAGLEGQVEAHEHLTAEALDLIIEGTRDRNYRHFMQAQAPDWHSPFSLAGAFAGGIIDPINILSCFIPIGAVEGMAATAATRAGQALSRGQYNLIRAKAGAIAGFTGAAAVEPIIWSAMQDVQNDDYGMTQSLINLAFGSILGAAITPGFGMVGDFLRARRHAPQPWEYLPSTAESEMFMRANANRITNERMAANPELDIEIVREAAASDALIYDQMLRRIGYEEQQPIASLYLRHGLEIHNGEMFAQRVELASRAVRDLEDELTALRERQALSENDSGLRFADGPMEEQNILSQLESARANQAEAKRIADQDLMELTGQTQQNTGTNVSQGNQPLRSIIDQNKSGELATATIFGDEGRAILRVFKANDEESVRAGIAHISRRIFERYAKKSQSDSSLAQSYRALEKEYGVGEDGVWNIVQEQRFAEDFVNYARGGKAPVAQLVPAFEAIRERMLDNFADADAAGVTISDTTRNFFDSILATPIHQAVGHYQNALADIMTQRWAHDLIPNNGRSPDGNIGLGAEISESIRAENTEARGETGNNYDPGNIPETDVRLQEIAERQYAEGRAELDNMLASAGNDIEFVNALRNDLDKDILELDKAIAKTDSVYEFLDEYLACVWRGGVS